MAISSYVISPNGDYILIGTDVEPIYRHSKLARYWVYSLTTKTMAYINRDIPVTLINLTAKIRLAVTGTSRIVFIFENVLYLRAVDGSSQYVIGGAEGMCIGIDNCLIMLDRNANDVFNGVADWAYEEEVFSDDVATWMMSDDLILYMRFEEAGREHFQYDWYDASLPYNGHVSIAYPKPGVTSMTMPTLYAHSISLNKTSRLPSLSSSNTFIYALQPAYRCPSPSSCSVIFRTIPRLQTSWTLVGGVVSFDQASVAVWHDMYTYTATTGWVMPTTPAPRVYDDVHLIDVEDGESHAQIRLFEYKITVDQAVATPVKYLTPVRACACMYV